LASSAWISAYSSEIQAGRSFGRKAMNSKFWDGHWNPTLYGVYSMPTTSLVQFPMLSGNAGIEFGPGTASLPYTTGAAYAIQSFLGPSATLTNVAQVLRNIGNGDEQVFTCTTPPCTQSNVKYAFNHLYNRPSYGGGTRYTVYDSAVDYTGMRFVAANTHTTFPGFRVSNSTSRVGINAYDLYTGYTLSQGGLNGLPFVYTMDIFATTSPYDAFGTRTAGVQYLAFATNYKTVNEPNARGRSNADIDYYEFAVVFFDEFDNAHLFNLFDYNRALPGDERSIFLADNINWDGVNGISSQPNVDAYGETAAISASVYSAIGKTIRILGLRTFEANPSTCPSYVGAGYTMSRLIWSYVSAYSMMMTDYGSDTLSGTPIDIGDLCNIVKLSTRPQAQPEMGFVVEGSWQQTTGGGGCTAAHYNVAFHKPRRTDMSAQGAAPNMQLPYAPPGPAGQPYGVALFQNSFNPLANGSSYSPLTRKGTLTAAQSVLIDSMGSAAQPVVVTGGYRRCSGLNPAWTMPGLPATVDAYCNAGTMWVYMHNSTCTTQDNNITAATVSNWNTPACQALWNQAKCPDGSGTCTPVPAGDPYRYLIDQWRSEPVESTIAAVPRATTPAVSIPPIVIANVPFSVSFAGLNGLSGSMLSVQSAVNSFYGVYKQSLSYLVSSGDAGTSVPMYNGSVVSQPLVPGSATATLKNADGTDLTSLSFTVQPDSVLPSNTLPLLDVSVTLPAGATNGSLVITYAWVPVTGGATTPLFEIAPPGASTSTYYGWDWIGRSGGTTSSNGAVTTVSGTVTYTLSTCGTSVCFTAPAIGTWVVPGGFHEIRAFNGSPYTTIISRSNEFYIPL